MNASIILAEAGDLAGWHEAKAQLDPNCASNPTLEKRWTSAKLD
jgi:hypothetical protein